MYIYVCMYGVFWFVSVKGIRHGLSSVVFTLPRKARHSRSEATTFVTANCTKHRLKPANSTDYSLHIRQTKSPHDIG